MRDRKLLKLLDRWLGVPLLWLRGLFTRRRALAPVAPGERVLVVKFSAMGDTLLLLPLLKAAKAQLGPEGRLDVLCTRVNQAVLKAVAWPDRLHLFEPSRPWGLAGLLPALRGARYDRVIDFDQWLRATALIAAFSGAKGRAGFSTAGQAKHFAAHAAVPNRKDAHEFEQFKELFAAAGFDPSKVERYDGFLMREGFLGARPQARDPKLVVLHPGTGTRTGWQREWPIERFAELGRRLKRERGARIALSGAGEYERALCARLEGDERCVDGGLKALVELLGRAGLLVCGNTGVMHLAAGLGTPLLALHGPNPAVKWGPLGRDARVIQAHVPCSPCLSLGFEFGCPIRPCMESISVEEAAAAAMETMGRTA